MKKYAQLKSFCHVRRLQVYMYAFMYVESEIMPVEKKFPATKILFWTTIKCQLQEQSKKIELGLVTYIQKIMS